MLSPVQRWLADPSVSRWEQPSYNALLGLGATSARLRKKQAFVLWRQVFSIRKEVSALAWAKLYAVNARLLVDAHPDVFVRVRDLSLEDQWLHCVAHHASYVQYNSERVAAGMKSIPILRALGHDHVLSQALVEMAWMPSEQIDFWRIAFPEDPMHDKMEVALGVQVIRRNALDGYLRARKHLLVQEQHDVVDLAILEDD